MPVVEWIAFTVGLVMIVATAFSLLSWGLVHRHRAWDARSITVLQRFIWSLFKRGAALTNTRSMRERVLSLMVPLTVLALLIGRLAMMIIGWGLVLWPLADDSLVFSIREAASATVTLGILTSERFAPSTIDILAAMSGLTVIAFSIGYLPALRQIISQQVEHAYRMDALAGMPPWGPRILGDAAVCEDLDGLESHYALWINELAQAEERVAAFSLLGYVRSPVENGSVVLGNLAKCDAAALHIASSPESAPPAAAECLAVGMNAIRGWRAKMGVGRRDPEWARRQRMTQVEFERGYRELESCGFPLTRDADAAWRSFRELRRYYEDAALELAEATLAPSTIWAGHRRGEPFQLLPPGPPSLHPRNGARFSVRRAAIEIAAPGDEA